MNIHAIRVIYKYEMLRAFETVAQSFASSVMWARPPQSPSLSV